EGGGESVAPTAIRSAVARDIPIPRPPFLGTRVVDAVPLDAIYPYIDKIALFRGQWQLKQGTQDEELYLRQIADEAEPLLRRLQEQAKAERILQPKVVYGYFPVGSEGNDLVIYDPDSPRREIVDDEVVSFGADGEVAV